MRCTYKLSFKNGVRKLEVKEIPLSLNEGFQKLVRDLESNNRLLEELLK